MNTKNKEAVAYCRVQPGEQYEETIEQQKNIINKYAEENGYTIAEWYCDKVWFDKKNVRPEFRRMMNSVKRGKIPCIIVPQIERFACDVWDFAESAKALAEHNCGFVSVENQIDDSPVGMNLPAMMLNLAQYYADQCARAGVPTER